MHTDDGADHRTGGDANACLKISQRVIRPLGDRLDQFGEAGEPEAASFRIATYDGAADPNVELDRYVFAGA